jgi:hypothetical protein
LNKAPNEFPTLWLHGVKSDSELVAVQMQIASTYHAFRIGSDRRSKAVLATINLLYSNDFRSQVSEHASAVWTRNIAAEIENANFLKNAAHVT